MKLHGYYRSSTSYRLRIALELKGLDYENIPINLLKSEQRGESFTTRNPFASVPMLETDGVDRAQSMAMIEWLDEAYPERPLLPVDIEQRYIARELGMAIATELHAPLNLPVLKWLKEEYGKSQDEIDTWYRHWLARTLSPVETRLAQLGSGDFLFDRPGYFEVILLPQVYNARRFAFDIDALSHIAQIEAACLAMDEFKRAHPDTQPDNPDNA